MKYSFLVKDKKLLNIKELHSLIALIKYKPEHSLINQCHHKELIDLLGNIFYIGFTNNKQDKKIEDDTKIMKT